MPRSGHPGMTACLSAGRPLPALDSSLSRRPLPWLNLCTACGLMAKMRRHGTLSSSLARRRLPRSLGGEPELFRGVGSVLLLERATGAHARHAFLTSRRRLVRAALAVGAAFSKSSHRLADP